MLNTSSYFNENFSEQDQITFKGKAKNNIQSQGIPSIKYPSLEYHYEFWTKDGSLYACIHNNHRKDDQNLTSWIQSLVNPLLNHLSKTLNVNLENSRLNGVAINQASHIVNIEVKRGLTIPNAKFSATVMHEIISYTKNKI